MKKSALILGCGNIGALYDLNDDSKVWSHAKAFSKFRDIKFSVSDIDFKKAKRVADKYKINAVPFISEPDFSSYDLVSITSPTETHYDLLKKLMQQKVPVILCEKPIAADVKQLEALQKLYKKSSSKILVNYIRRFQPGYAVLKKYLTKIDAKINCTAINIKYQRGFLNNGTHAFDLLEFLFDKPFLFEKFHVQTAVYDAFEKDPTITGSCNFNNIPVSIAGVKNAAYAIFEIEIFLNSKKVVICHSGDEIRFYEAQKDRALAENIKLRQTNILTNYMMPVVKHALKIENGNSISDNFLQALELNKRAVKIISAIKEK